MNRFKINHLMVFRGVFQMSFETDDELHDPGPLGAHGNNVGLDVLHSRVAFLGQTFSLSLHLTHGGLSLA